MHFTNKISIFCVSVARSDYRLLARHQKIPQSPTQRLRIRLYQTS